MNNEKNKKNYNKLLNTFGYDEARIEKYYPKALEPVAKLSDLNISPRTFFNWRALKAIDYEGVESDDARGWVRLNLIEVIWVRIIETFRDFGVPIKEIVRIKQLLFGNLFPQITAHSEEIIAEFEKKFKGLENSAEMLEAVKKVFASPETYIKPELSSVLASHIVEILLGGARLSLLYSKEGIKIDGSRNATKGLLKEIEEFKTKPFICIPLNNLIEEFIEFDKTETLSREFGLFSETEESVIKALRNDDVKEIQIRKSNENEPTIIQITKREITGEKVRMIKRLLGMNDFDEMRVVLRNDKHIFIESKSKNKTH